VDNDGDGNVCDSDDKEQVWKKISRKKVAGMEYEYERREEEN
jgi:hypothetical protein